MPERSNVLSQIVKQVGIFNFKDLYNFCYQWFLDEGYLLSEDRYEEKMSDAGKEVKIKWTARKKVTDYFQNEIEMKWHILYMTDVEIERGKKKEKTNKGEVRFDIKADLVKDYELKWEDKPALRFLRGVYDKYIIRSTIDEYEDRLFDRVNSLISEVKAFLQLEGK